MADPPEKHRGSRPYLPPPPDEAPESVDVPRMDPPPASLEAMVRSRPGSPLPPVRQLPRLGVVVLAALVVAVLVYLLIRS